jgi:hypothetical protein
MNTMLLLLSLAASPPEVRPHPTTPVVARRKLEDPRTSRRLLIGGGVSLGLAFSLELAGAIISTRCQSGDWCGGGVVYAWGSRDAGTRFTLLTGGTSSAYVHARVLAVPLLATGYGLTVRGAALRGRRVAVDGGTVAQRRLRARGWTLLGTGIGVYALSRLVRLGFGLGGVCQRAACVHGLDLASLAAARALMVTGSAGLAFRRGYLGGVTLGPSASGPGDVGLVVSGMF